MTMLDTLRQRHESAQDVSWKLKDALPDSRSFAALEYIDHSPIFRAVSENCVVQGDAETIWYAATAWWVSQFAETELAALSLATELLDGPDIWPELKFNLADQVGDEARHFAIFLQLSAELPRQSCGTWFRRFETAVLESSDWRLRHLALSLILESQAIVNLRSLRTDLSFPKAAWAARLILADEARHVAVGRAVAESWMKEASSEELRDAQEWILSLLRIVTNRYSEGPILPKIGCSNLFEPSFASSLTSSGNVKILTGLQSLGVIDDDIRSEWEELLAIGEKI
jgi:hypothetical protein